jgi:hypothetical protein
MTKHLVGRQQSLQDGIGLAEMCNPNRGIREHKAHWSWTLERPAARNRFHPRRLSAQRGQAFACLDANKYLHSLPKQVGLVRTGVGSFHSALKELIVDGHGRSHSFLLGIRTDVL